LLVGLAALVVTASDRALAEPRVCVRAETPGPIVLPDGSTHDAGSIRLCLHQRHSPVAGLHRAYVNGYAVGMFVSRRSESEGLRTLWRCNPTRTPLVIALVCGAFPEGRPYMMFHRDESGTMVLKGYGVRFGDRYQVYDLNATKSSNRQLAESLRSTADDDVVLLAAVVN
jgi:hypothetical protein